jgi:hypothetical protein
VNRDIPKAVVLLRFEGVSGRCGDVYVAGLSFVAGQGQVVSSSTPLYMTYEPEPEPGASVVQRCALPVRTNQLVAEVWDAGGGVGRGAAPVFRQAFDYDYSFILRE